MGWENDVSTGGYRYFLDVKCRRSREVSDSHNLRIDVSLREGFREARKATILGNYDIASLSADVFLDEAKWTARNTPAERIQPFRTLLGAINANRDGVQEKILTLIKRDWSTNSLIRDYRVDRFFLPWQTIHTGLRVVNDEFKVLVFSTDPQAVQEELVANDAGRA
jgi:hypothetical protein